MILRAVISIIRGYFISSLKILKLHVSENGSSAGGGYITGERPEIIVPQVGIIY